MGESRGSCPRGGAEMGGGGIEGGLLFIGGGRYWGLFFIARCGGRVAIGEGGRFYWEGCGTNPSDPTPGSPPATPLNPPPTPQDPPMTPSPHDPPGSPP